MASMLVGEARIGPISSHQFVTRLQSKMALSLLENGYAINVRGSLVWVSKRDQSQAAKSNEEREGSTSAAETSSHM
jgi:hypothetical protein